ncbi:MAG: hybrid sensor histidine kinase/response regulator [Candidatus Delongbacteria bacterium]|nr:hybrid sensor histidine kinase/response regulator [Candidatus Delongbacteria bacterium]
MILIVDDHLENIQVVGKILKFRNYDISFTTKSSEVLDIAKIKIPDLILLDIMMPGENGFEVALKLKNDDILKEIPIIFITALDDGDSIVKAFQSGGTDYIVKPVNKDELISRVKTQLDLKMTKDELLNKNIELNKMLKFKDQMLGMAAHDLKNPLNAILGYSELLQFNFENESHKNSQKILDTMIGIAVSMESLLREMLDLSAIQSGIIKIHNIQTDLLMLFRNCILKNTVMAAKKNIELKFLFSNIPETILTDPNKIDQVLSNLISNSIKYSHSDTKVIINLQFIDGKIVFYVEDQGQGIPENEKHLVFEPFTRTSVKATGGESSNGLGLAIIKKILEAMNGEIDLITEVGKGSKFTITIPTSDQIR